MELLLSPLLFAASSFFICSSHSSSSESLFFFSVTESDTFGATKGTSGLLLKSETSSTPTSRTCFALDVRSSATSGARISIISDAVCAEVLAVDIPSSSASSWMLNETCPRVLNRLSIARWATSLEFPATSKFRQSASSTDSCPMYPSAKSTRAFLCKPSVRSEAPT